MGNLGLKTYLGFSFVLVGLFSVLSFSTSLGYSLINAINITVFWWLVILLIYVLILYCLKFYYSKQNNKYTIPILLYLLWNIISIIRGGVIADGYWDWKNLVGNSFALLLPLYAYLATNERAVQWMLVYFFNFGLLFFLFFITIFIGNGAWGFYLAPVSFIMLFFPILSIRWKIIIGLLTFIVVTTDISVRSNVIKFTVPSIFMLIYYWRNIFTVKILNNIRILLLISPFILFLLGIIGVFNIFKMDEYIKGGDISIQQTDALGVKTEGNIKDDTRTLIYEEVLYSAKITKSWIIGRSAARGNFSEGFGMSDLNKRNERNTNEVAITNIFTWTGIVGVLLYFFIFYKASYLAINKSNNIFIKLIGLFVAFRWVYAWVEDINNFTISYLTLWIMIGLSFSISFRYMTNKEVIIWARGIFNAKYRQLYYYTKSKRDE